MRPAGKLSAAIEILDDFAARRVPLKTAIADWGRENRYAGAKDRAWISGLCLDALRRRNSLAALMGSSGVAFMMILLVSFANIKAGEFPITAILVVGLYMIKEIMAIFRYDDVSQISHITGAACGAVFGYLRTVSARRPSGGPAPAGGGGPAATG